MTKEILIYAEVTKSGYVHPVFFTLAAKAQELAQKLYDTIISALIITSKGKTETVKEGFVKCGFDKVYAFEDERFGNYNTELFSSCAIELVNEIHPEIFLIGATTQGRDLGPRISSSLHTGLTADCIELDINEKGMLAATRPTFGGKLMATILCKNHPQMATVRPGVFKPLEQDVIRNTEIIYKNITSVVTPKVELIDFIKGLEDEINDLDSAEIIVSGGKGMKNAEGFKLIESLAKALNGAVGASRGAVEMGLADHKMQIGQTGKTVSPKLYIACGISGAIQHTVGMDGSKRIFAINTDEKAPIFDIADIGYVGDAFEIIPQLIDKLSQKTD